MKLNGMDLGGAVGVGVDGFIDEVFFLLLSVLFFCSGNDVEELHRYLASLHF